MNDSSAPSPPPAGRVSAQWVDRYLAFLGLRRRPPSHEAVSELTRAQVLAVTFENVTALLRRNAHLGRPVPPVDPEAVLASWEERRGGGVCFEIADVFGRLLAELGYRVHPVLGFITFPGSHQAVLLELDGARYLLDVGNGAPFFEPIPLGITTELERAGLTYRFRPDEKSRQFVQERWVDGRWTPYCRYLLDLADPQERAAAYQRHHRPGETWVIGTVTLIRCHEEQLFLLRDGELSHFTSRQKSGPRVCSLEEQVRLAAEIFGLPALPIERGIAARDRIALEHRRPDPSP